MPAQTKTFQNHLFSFDAGALALHKNLMPCVIFGCQEPVRVANDMAELDAQIVCIKPGVAHSVVVRSGGAEIIYLDGVQLSMQTADFEPLGAEWRMFPTVFETSDHLTMTRFRTMLEGRRPPPDRKVMGIVRDIYASPMVRMSQIELAERLGLERTQALRHFKSTTGQTFRKFKIWAAILATARSAHQGERIGIAGVDAGFSDAAHTARTAMTTFGLTPTKGLSGLTRMQTLD